MTDVDLLLTGGYVVVSSDQIISDGAVAISGNRIVAVGTSSDVGATVRAARTIDTTGRAVLPGLINAHNHTCQSTARGLADDLPVTEWLSRIVPFEATLEAEDVRASVRLACVEMIEFAARAGRLMGVQSHPVLVHHLHEVEDQLVADVLRVAE